MKLRVDHFNIQDTHVFPDIRIDRRPQLVRADLALNVDTRHLPLSMNAGVRPTRTMNSDASPVDQADGTRQLPLDRSQIFLNLPPVKVCAVIL